MSKQQVPFMSIIIPAYNAESVIKSSLSSIPNDGTGSLEIIVIDDGSIDRTRDEVMSYKVDSGLNIQLITTKNMGPAHARNIGIERATGEYTLFMDADDVFRPEVFHVIEKELNNNESPDLIIFGFKITNVLGETVNIYQHSRLAFDKKDTKDYFTELYKSNLLNQVWNKVYRTSLVKTISFEDLKYGEDRIFILEYLKKTRNALVIEDVLYDYRIVDDNSLISKFHSDKLEITLLIDERVRDFSRKVGATSSKDTSTLDFMFIKGIISCMTVMFAGSCPYDTKERRKNISKIISHPKVIEVLNRKSSVPTYMSVLFAIMRTKNTRLNYYMVKNIHLVSMIAPGSFIKLKHNK